MLVDESVYQTVERKVAWWDEGLVETTVALKDYSLVD